MELDPRQQHGQLADRGLHHQRREPRRQSASSSRSSTSSTPARSTPRSASSRSPRTTSCGTRPSRSRTTSPGTAGTTRSPSARPRRSTTPRTCSSPARRASTSTTRSPTSTPTPTTTWPTRTGRRPPVTLAASRCAGTTSPGRTKPLQPLDVWYGGVYAQDEWQASRNLKVTYGLRVDVRPSATPATRTRTPTPSRSATRAGTRSSTRRRSCRTPSILWSPRVGFNWDVTGNRTTQVRGGTGVFTGPPAYVWISNQIGNTGVLTGFEQLDNTKARPWNPNPDAYKPTDRHRGPGLELRARADGPGLQVPADVAHQHRGRPAAALGPHRHGRVHLQPRRQRHLLHQRQPPGGADGVRRAPTTAPAGRATGSTPTSRTPSC